MSEQRLLQRAGKRKLQNRCAALLIVSRLALLPPRVRLWEQSHPHVRAAVGCEQTRRSCGRTLHSPASGRVQAGDALSLLRYASWMAGGVEARPPAGARPHDQPPPRRYRTTRGGRESRLVPRSNATTLPATARTPPNPLPNQAVLPTPTRCAPRLAPSPARRPAPLLVAPLPGAVSLASVAHHRLRHRGYAPAAWLGCITLCTDPVAYPRHLAHNSSGATRTAATAAALSASSAAGAWSKSFLFSSTLGAGLIMVRCSR